MQVHTTPKEGTMRKLHQILHCQPQLLLVAALIGSVAPLSMLMSFTTPAQVYATETEEWRTINDITYMQDMTAEICNKSQVGDSKALIDKRDAGYTNDGVAHSYIVKKLSDGNCWMTQNMNLTNKALTAEDSNAPKSGYTIPTWLASSWGTTSTSNSVYYAKGNGTPDSDNYSSNDVNHYGAYYTWCAATAGTCANNDEASGSICPKGWRLPTTNKTSTNATGYSYSYNKLVADNNYLRVGTNWSEDVIGNGYWLGGKIADAKGAAFFPAAGVINSAGNLVSVGLSGNYWSSTPDGSTTYNLVFNSGINPSDSTYRYLGLSVRCVNNPDIHSTNIPPQLGTNQALIEVTVTPTLTLDVSGGSFSSQITPGQMVTGTIAATVTTNTTYNVTLKSDKPNLTAAGVSSTEIAASSDVVAGTNAWGIKKDGAYAALTDTATEFDSTTEDNANLGSHKHTWDIGISTAATIPTGTYSTDIIVTANSN